MNIKVFSSDLVSLKAKGVYAIMLSHDKIWRVSEILADTSNGRDSVYSALSELQAFGVVEKVTVRNAIGSYAGGGWRIIK